MSTESSSAPQKATKPSAKVVNPYAKKKSKAAPSNTNGTTTASRGTLKPVEIGVSASFSQAFASVEDTSHFQSEQSSVNQRASGNTLDWAAQRSFDESAAAAAAEKSGPLSDRDHHALLQPHVLYVSTKQKGNGILKHIRNVPFAYSNMVPDYIMNTSRCALFLSCKYHSLYPNYIHRRIAELKSDFTLRVLLVLVDVDDNASTLLFLNKLAVVNNMTLILAWSEEEAARYLETYKAFDGKDASSIQRREQTNFIDQASDVVTAVKGVNKTDAAHMLEQFSTVKAVIAASQEELALCPGLGEVKIQRLHDAFHKPFSSRRAKRRKEEREAAAAGGDGHNEDEETTRAPVGTIKGESDIDGKLPAKEMQAEEDE